MQPAIYRIFHCLASQHLASLSSKLYLYFTVLNCLNGSTLTSFWVLRGISKDSLSCVLSSEHSMSPQEEMAMNTFSIEYSVFPPYLLIRLHLAPFVLMHRPELCLMLPSYNNITQLRSIGCQACRWLKHKSANSSLQNNTTSQNAVDKTITKVDPICMQCEM